MIFRLRRLDLNKIELPVSVYCVCPEEAYLNDQAAAKELMADGYGLLTVGADGQVQKRHDTIPIVQQIGDQEFKSELTSLPPTIRRRLAESFDRYNHNAPSGVADVSEVLEGLVLRAGRDAAKKGFISSGDVRPGAPAATLAALLASSQGRNAAAAIGGAQSYISMYRNTAHHFPKNKRQAFRKYRDCRHGFLDGLKKVHQFREQMRGIGLSGLL